MRKTRLTRSLSVTVALLAVLLVAMTLGTLGHSHNGSSEQTCQICHLNHQPAERPLSAVRVPVLTVAGETHIAIEHDFAPEPMLRRLPARAPPSA